LQFELVARGPAQPQLGALRPLVEMHGAEHEVLGGVCPLEVPMAATTLTDRELLLIFLVVLLLVMVAVLVRRFPRR
jgi:hypothetical protein